MLTYFLTALFLCFLLFCLSMLTKMSPSPSNKGKFSPFECGFEPLNSMRRPFSVRYFILVVLFLIFDVETVLLMPCLVNIVTIGDLNVPIYMLAFLVLLIWGLLLEWKNGIFEWKYLG